MRHIRSTALAATVFVMVALLAPIAGAQGNKEKPTATDVGITADEIHIAVIADVDNPIRPGLFEGSKRGVEAWGKWMNDKFGGLAGRKVVVDFLEGGLNANESRNAAIQACESDFATVGTTALFLSNVDDLTNCQDSTGAATGLPDLALLQTETAHVCAPTSWAVIPNALDCATKDAPEETYRAQEGSIRYYLKHVSKDLHGIWAVPSDLKATKNASLPGFTGSVDLGVKKDGQGFFDLSGLAPQSAYTPVVQVMKDNSSTYGRSGLDYKGMVQLRKEAKLQGLNSVKVWDCSLQCYDKRFLSEGGADVEGQYVWLGFLPFEEKNKNKTLRDFIKYVGADKADGFAMQAWLSGLYFRDVVNAVVKAKGVNGVTRAAILEQIPKQNGFTGDGILGKTNVGAKEPGPCFVMTQVKNDKFVRVYPKKPGTFDCKKSNIVEVKLDLIS